MVEHEARAQNRADVGDEKQPEVDDGLDLIDRLGRIPTGRVVVRRQSHAARCLDQDSQQATLPRSVKGLRRLETSDYTHDFVSSVFDGRK